ncbi:MAG: phosphatase PAP2 family protein [Solirubrobacteraceae bacterium]|jgi:undecaprenyl-diphosphatase
MPDRARMALLAAAGFATALIITALVAFEWPLAALHDANVLAGFRALASSPRIDTAANWIAGAATPLPYVLLGAGFVGVALARGRPRLALAVPFAMAAASGTTELLKHAGRVRYAAALGPYGQIPVPSWPSGHATAAMMVALSAVLVSPPVLRGLAALLGSALAVAVSFSMLILTRHYPSDVLGGFLVAGMWMSLTVALLWSSERRRVPRHSVDEGAAGARSALLPAALAAAGLAAGLVTSLVASTHVHASGSLIAGATTIAIIAAVMTGGLLVALRPQRDARREATTGSRRRLPAARSWTPER